MTGVQTHLLQYYSPIHYPLKAMETLPGALCNMMIKKKYKKEKFCIKKCLMKLLQNRYKI